MKFTNFFLIYLISISPVFCRSSNPIYKVKTQPIEARVNDLLKRMTPEEKFAQMYSYYLGKSPRGDNADLTVIRMDSLFKNGMGQLCQLGKRRDMLGVTTIVNKTQKYLLENTRLGIPAFIHEEGLHGMIANGISSFPTPIAMSCSFNESLVNKVYDKIGREMRLAGMNIVLSPVLDVAREPRWGRFEETFGEDPFWVSRMGVASVQGFQGTKTGSDFVDNKHVIATGKHFTGYSYTENGTNVSPSLATEHDLWEVFFPPFKAAIDEANLLSVMPSYNEINGIPSHGSKWLLTDVLRKKLHFKGIINSDYGGVQELQSLHHVVENNKEAALLAFKAGVDYDLPNQTCYTQLPQLLKEGKISEAEVNVYVRRILEIKFRLGLFDNPYADTQKAIQQVGDKEGNELVLNIARESIVLLKNSQNTLPLDMTTIKTLAIIGPNSTNCVLGAYYGTPKYVISVLDGFKNKFSEKINILSAEGCRITIDKKVKMQLAKQKPEDPDKFDEYSKSFYSTYPEDKESISRAVEIAKQSDAIVLCIGGNMATTGESFGEKPRGDRSDFLLSPAQQELLKQLKALNKKLIICLIHGGPISDPLVNDSMSTVLDCHYLGQETGTAIAEVISGQINPSGKLCYSLPLNAGQLPCFYNYKPSARRGYGYSSIQPAYPFGFGLSYTNFELRNLKIDKTEIKKDESTYATIDITNTGKTEGMEVVQLYIRDLVSSITRPINELKGVKKINLKPGEKQTIRFEITPAMLSFYNESYNFVVEPGDFEIGIGNSSYSKGMKKVKLNVN